MIKEPNFMFFILTLLWIALTGYYWYRSWFDPSGLRESIRQDVKRTPTWYLPRSVTLDYIDKPYWIYFIRFISTVSLLIGLAFFILAIFS